MELVATIAGSAKAAAATTATTTAATAATTATAAGAAGGALSLSTVLNGLTLASSALSLFGGNQQARSIMSDAQARTRTLTLMSEEEKLAARQEELSAKAASNETLERLNRTLAAQRLAFSANGVDGDFGGAAALADNTLDRAADDISFTREDANMRILQRRRQSAEYLRERGIVRANGEARALAARRNGALRGVSVLGNLS